MTDLGATTTRQQTIDLDIGDMSIPVKVPQSMVRIVGFKVHPKSIPPGTTCKTDLVGYDGDPSEGYELIGDDIKTSISFSYTVTIKNSNQAWATRLEQYLSYGNPKLQWE